MKCRVCQSEVAPDDIFQTTFLCRKCGYSGDRRAPGRQLHLQDALVTTTVVLVIGLTIFAFFSRSGKTKFIQRTTLTASELEKIKTMTQEDAEGLGGLCNHDGDAVCLQATLERLRELDPKNVVYAIRMAQLKQEQRKYPEALQLYEELMNAGEGNYEIFAGYGIVLDRLDRNEDAMRWYQEALALNPGLVDIAKNLALVLVKAGKPTEAVSLLTSFINKYPDAKNYLEGNISSIQATYGLTEGIKNELNKQIKLVAVASGHHFLPIKLSINKPPQMFLVDTGATTVNMNSRDFYAHFSDVDSVEAQLVTANGKAQGYVATVPNLYVGNIEVTDVEVSHCKSCLNLAGQSLLKKFNMTTSKKGQLEYLTLTLRE